MNLADLTGLWSIHIPEYYVEASSQRHRGCCERGGNNGRPRSSSRIHIHWCHSAAGEHALLISRAVPASPKASLQIRQGILLLAAIPCLGLTISGSNGLESCRLSSQVKSQAFWREHVQGCQITWFCAICICTFCWISRATWK